MCEITESESLERRLESLAAENERLKAAIREHRDERGDSRCWLDDIRLYHALEETTTADTVLPPKCEFLESCSRYWEQRQWPAEKQHGPSEMTMQQLTAEVERLTRQLRFTRADLAKESAERQEAEVKRLRERAERASGS